MTDNSSANILPFPTNRFDLTALLELQRWATEAPLKGWYVQPGDGDGDRLVERAKNGDEYVVVTYGDARNSGDFIVQPDRGRWLRMDCADAAVATFRTLQGALESVCPTLLPCCLPRCARLTDGPPDGVVRLPSPTIENRRAAGPAAPITDTLCTDNSPQP
jgi:hypothetical protein